MKESVVITLFVGICLNTHYTHAWGTYVCDIKEQGLQKIEEVCSESASKFHSPLSALESKLERVLTFVEEIKTAEDSWFHITKRSGMVERDLSQHEENTPKDRHEDKTENDGRTNDQGESMEDRRNEDHPKEDQNGNREEEKSRNEDRGNDDERKNRRDRMSENDRQNDRNGMQDNNRSSKTRENDRENERVRVEDDDDVDDNNNNDNNHRKQDNRNNDRLEKENKQDNETGPNKGECVTQVMDSHETIGMFYMMSYQHGHCSNRNPIRQPIRYCLGYCPTKTFIDRDSGMWNQGNDCKSCQATAFETLRILLSCDDGFTFEKKFKNVVDCNCRKCYPLGNKNNN